MKPIAVHCNPILKASLSLTCWGQIPLQPFGSPTQSFGLHLHNLYSCTPCLRHTTPHAAVLMINRQCVQATSRDTCAPYTGDAGYIDNISVIAVGGEQKALPYIHPTSSGSREGCACLEEKQTCRALSPDATGTLHDDVRRKWHALPRLTAHSKLVVYPETHQQKQHKYHVQQLGH